METPRALRVITKSLVITLVMSFVSCSSAPKKNANSPEPEKGNAQSVGVKNSPPEVLGPPDPVGPMPVGAQPAGPSYGPDPIEIRPVVLVLGPGLARGFAYAGVLRALHDEKIPVGAIICTEMGALIGGLYGESSTINEFEWSLVKFKEDFFTKDSGLFSSLLNADGDTGKLNETLQHEFGSKDLKESKVRLQIVLRNEKGNNSFLVDHGSVNSAVRGALGLTGFVSSTDWNGQKVTSAGAIRPFGVSEARLLGIGPVVVVDVLHSGSAEGKAIKSKPLLSYLQQAKNSGQEELKAADFVITPDLNGIGFLDYEKKNDIVFRGQNAVILKRMELRHLVGLPQEDSQP